MKKIFALTMLAVVLFGCGKDELPEPDNFEGTSWTAPDDIARLIYGGSCTTTVEFLENGTCQEIDKRPTGMFAGTTVETGTYTSKGDSVSWKIGSLTISGKATGSVLSTDMGTIAGGKRIYTKD